MITNFKRLDLGFNKTEEGSNNGFACGSMGQRDVKIYCNEVSGEFENTTRIIPLIELWPESRTYNDGYYR